MLYRCGSALPPISWIRKRPFLNIRSVLQLSMGDERPDRTRSDSSSPRARPSPTASSRRATPSPTPVSPPRSSHASSVGRPPHCSSRALSSTGCRSLAPVCQSRNPRTARGGGGGKEDGPRRMAVENATILSSVQLLHRGGECMGEGTDGMRRSLRRKRGI